MLLLLLLRGAPGVQPGPAGNLGHLAARGARWQQRICGSVPSMPHLCRGSSRSASSCPPWWREAAQARTGGPGETPPPASHPECVCVKGSVATQSNKRPSPTLLQPPSPTAQVLLPMAQPHPTPCPGTKPLIHPVSPSSLLGRGGRDPQASSIEGKVEGLGMPRKHIPGGRASFGLSFFFLPQIF